MLKRLVSTVTEYSFIEGTRKFFPVKKMRNDFLEKYQLRLMRKLVSHAFAKSEFYHQFYTDHGIKAKDIPNLHFKDLPITTKKDITENKQRVFTDPNLNFQEVYDFIYQPRAKGSSGKVPENTNYYKDNYVCFTTSGSLGTQMVVVYSRNEWNKILTTFALSPLSLPRTGEKKKKLVGILRTAGTSGGSLIFRALPEAYFNTKELSVLSSTDEIIKELNAFQPDHIVSYPGLFVSLMPYKKSGALKVFPKLIRLAGEILTDKQQKEIANEFQSEVINGYGASECLIIGSKKMGDTCFNLSPHCSKVEVLNDKDEQVKPGEMGRVVATNFLNFTQPFIRYNLGDIAIYGLNERGEPCIKEIVSRNYKPVYFENNWGKQSYFHPFAMYETLMYVPEVVKSQITLGENTLCARIVASDQGVQNVTHKFKTFLQEQNLDQKVKFTIDRVNEIRPEPNGKIPFIKYETSTA